LHFFVNYTFVLCIIYKQINSLNFESRTKVWTMLLATDKGAFGKKSIHTMVSKLLKIY